MSSCLPGKHPLALYRTDRFLAQTVSDFITPAVASGDAALLVTTRNHAGLFKEKLRGAGVDVEGAIGDGRTVFLDAASTVTGCMTSSGPDFTRFCDTVGGVLDRLTANGRALRVYGEMVALLWADGNLAAAITLARAGRSVRVLEQAPTVGGGARTEELTLPGFRHDVCSAVHPFGRISPFFTEAGLDRYGLRWIEPPAALAHPLDGGGAVIVTRDVETTARPLGRDRDPYRRLFGPLARDTCASAEIGTSAPAGVAIRTRSMLSRS